MREMMMMNKKVVVKRIAKMRINNREMKKKMQITIVNRKKKSMSREKQRIEKREKWRMQ